MLHAGNSPQAERQTLPQSKRLENNFLSKWSQETSWFQPKVIKKYKEGHFILTKGEIQQDELSILNYMLQIQGIHIHKRNITKAQSIHCTPHNNSGNLQHPSLINKQIGETQTKQRNSETNRSYESNGFNRYLYNISS